MVGAVYVVCAAAHGCAVSWLLSPPGSSGGESRPAGCCEGTAVWYLIGAAVIWIVCGVWAYGLTFAYFQGEFCVSPEERDDEWRKKKLHADRIFALDAALWGPIGVLTALIMGQTHHGLKFRISERNERCEKQ